MDHGAERGNPEKNIFSWHNVYIYVCSVNIHNNIYIYMYVDMYIYIYIKMLYMNPDQHGNIFQY